MCHGNMFAIEILCGDIFEYYDSVEIKISFFYKIELLKFTNWTLNLSQNQYFMRTPALMRFEFI